MWGIDEDRLLGSITVDMSMNNVREPKTFAGRLMRCAAGGWSCVERRNGQFYIIAKARAWLLLAHELSKGVAELVCLHGLNTLDDETYAAVIDRADHIEYEPWMLQAGPEAWRRLLAVLPPGRPLAEMLMHIARLDPDALEDLMMAVMSDPARARQLLAEIGDLCDRDV
jgi:hypothetical protein